MAIIKAMYTQVKKESPIQLVLDRMQQKTMEEYKLKLRDKVLKQKLNN